MFSIDFSAPYYCHKASLPTTNPVGLSVQFLGLFGQGVSLLLPEGNFE